jgi:signal peptide peptidase-like protein 2B
MGSGAIVLFSAVCAHAYTDIPPFAYTDVSSDGGSTFKFFSFGQVASFGPPLPTSTSGLRVVLATDSPWAFACSPLSRLTYPHALLASRGNCSFAQKAASAAASGASLLIVFDGLSGKYYPSATEAPGEPLVAGKCDVDPSSFCFDVPASEVDLPHALAGFRAACGGKCGSGLCALAADGGGGASRRACCVPDDYLVLGGTGVAAAVPPLLWLPAGPGAALAAAADAAPAEAPLLLRAGVRSVPNWDLSGLALWAVGVATAALASWGGAAAERRAWALRAGYGRPGLGVGAPSSVTSSPPPPLEALAGEALHLSPRQALLLLAFASAFLLGLFALLSLGVPIVWLVYAVFCAAACGALATLVAAPLLAAVAPDWTASARTISVPRPVLALFGAHLAFSVRPPDVVAGALAIGAVALWFALRHAPGAWAGQDAFGVALCVHAVAKLRLASLRSATLLLSALFFYDVFMVFVTPYLFAGRSVMVDVATAGAPAPPPAAGLPTPACYCRLHPDDAAVCGSGETMPILFAMPRLADWRGGMSMLGLGDIVVPAVALAVLLRYDFSSAARGSDGGGDGALRRAGSSDAGEDTVGLLFEPGDGGSGGSASPRRRNGSAGAGAGAGVGAGVGGPLNSEDCAPVGTPAALPSAGARPPLLPPRHAAGGAPLWAVGVGGYGAGLAMAQGAVMWSGMGQPALLYLVPCVLLPPIVLARARGEWHTLWHGEPERATADT